MKKILALFLFVFSLYFPNLLTADVYDDFIFLETIDIFQLILN